MGEERKEVLLAPLAVRVVAGFDYFLMFVIALSGGIVSGLPFLFDELFNFLALTDPTAYNEIITGLINAGLTLELFYGLLFAIGAVLVLVAFVGMVVALGTAYKKSWAVPLGVGVSILCIFASVTTYFFDVFFPIFGTIEYLNIIDVVLNIFFTVLAINVLFVGAFLLWQLDELSGFTKKAGRFVLVWNMNAISLYLMTLLLPGIWIVDLGLLEMLGVAYITVAFISFMNVLVRPVFTRLVAEAARWWLGFAISFILIILINAGILFITPLFIPEFVILGLPTAILGSIVLSAINASFVSIAGLDDDDSFFSKFVAKKILETVEEKGVSKTPGLVTVEIDGLSYDALQEALKRGYMPTVQSLLKSGKYKAAKWDCGLPSMTSSCQAGIMHGNNKDIPAFRWYFKPENRMVVSNNPTDASDIDKRASSGKGLLRNGGSSVSNLISGDASYSFFTMSTLTKKDAEAGRRRSEDLYYYLLNPYALNRSIVMTLWDVLVELGQIIRQTITRRKPRMNRLSHGYPFVRAATNIFMRDIATAMVTQDILRGSPAIYVTYLGYDEIAHHSGPFTSDALKSLKGLDKQIRRIFRVIEDYSPRPYNLFLISDHGQSAGWTFKQRYGKSLKDLISDLLEGKATVGEMEAVDAHRGYVAGLVDDLNEGREKAGIKGAADRSVHRRSQFFKKQVEKKALEQPSKELPEDAKPDDVIVCASGNLVQVYFTFQQERATLEDLETMFPGFIAQIVAHEGVGFIVVTDRDDGPVLLGKEGAVVLRTGKVKGENPLTPYGRVKVRIKQLLRLAEYPNSGEIIIISPIYPDGSVAAYEELIGNHGGLGGLQTEPFILYPSEIDVDGDNIINSDQIYPILNQHRES